MRTSSCIATLALRMRVSMSAIGSVIVIVRLPSPAGLRHTGHLAGVHQLAQADAAEPELAVHRRAAGRSAGSGCRPRTLNFGLRCCFSMSAFLAMYLLPFTLEREAEGVEQGLAFGIGAGGGDDRDVHAPGRVDLVVVDLREDQLLGDAERVVAAAVERCWPAGRGSRGCGGWPG